MKKREGLPGAFGVFRVPYKIIALSPLVFVHGWGDGWRDPKIFFVLLGLLLIFIHRLFQAENQANVLRDLSPPFKGLAGALAMFAALLFVQCLFLPLQLSLILPILFGMAMMAHLVFNPTTEWRELSLTRFMLVVAGLEGALVLVQFSGFDPILEKPITDFIKWRSTGTMGNPNVVAAYLGLHVLLFFTQKKITTPNWILGSSFIFLPLLFTFSRSVFLSLLMVMFFYSGFFRNRKFWIALLTSGLLVFFTSLTQSGSSLLHRTGLLNVDSITGRWNENLHAFSYLKGEGWIWGIGWNHYRLQSGAASDFIHNEFLGALVEGGIVGFILLVLIFIASIRFIQTASKAHRAIPLYAFVLCMVDFPLRSPTFLSTLILVALTHKRR